MAVKKQRDGRSKKRPGLEAQRRRLLEEAIRLFGQEGSRNVSISQLCDAAEISRPTFYRCFADKDELVATLYRDAVREPVERIMLRAIAAPKRDAGWLHVAIDGMLDAIFERSDVAAMLFVESSDPSSPAHRIIQRAFDVIASTLVEAMRRSDVAPFDVVTVKALLVACQWIVHDAIEKGLTPEARADAKRATHEIATRFFGRAVGPPSDLPSPS